MKASDMIGIFLAVILIITSKPAVMHGQGFDQNQGNKILEFNFPGLLIGTAEYDEGPTGTTVFYFPDGVMGAADVRGGATGTVNAPAVARGYEDKMIDAVVFSGGSWYGLSAATGVANEIKKMKAEVGQTDYIAGVLGGIIYDVGGRRFSRITPDDDLGKKAVRNAKANRFHLGAHGAGRFTMQGYYFYDAGGGSVDAYAHWPHSGQGGAYGEIGSTKIAVFTIVNALGTVVDRNGRVVRCGRNYEMEDCPSVTELIRNTAAMKKMRGNDSNGPTNNTTLTLVVTNQKLPYWALQRLATQVHTSMGRAIQPFSTQYDGDVLYAVTTGEIENPDLTPLELSVVASELAWDAVLNSVPPLPEKPVRTSNKTGLEQLRKYMGTYTFYGGGILKVDSDANGLWAQFTGNGRIYFDEGRTYRLIPTTNGRFIIDAPAQDIIEFEVMEANVQGIVINPETWPLRAKRNK